MTALVEFLVYLFGAVLALFATLTLLRPTARETTNLVSEDRLIFLVRDNRVIDTNLVARRLLDRSDSSRPEIDRLRRFLAQHFEDSELLLSPRDEQTDLMLQSRDQQVQVIRHDVGSSIRLKVIFVTDETPVDGDMHTLRAMETELETLRANTTAAPFLLWRQSNVGEVTWVNRSYLDTAEKKLGKQTDWPLPVLFPSLKGLAAKNKSESRRISVQNDDGENWYDCHITPIGSEILCTAIPADEAVRSENRRHEFTQTLTKTFAELAIGLAIFDRSRRLVLFNPALLDLTNLPTDFLTSRPSMVSFLDRLRENRVMPEPRDYRSWRTSISELEAAAADGTYGETWSLPDGQTYHVTGRPHPDGAVALLFEDISAEMSLTRHFRTELEPSQAVIDALEAAVAVFSPAGEITVSNQSYQELWDIDGKAFMTGDMAEATRRWHEMTAPTPVWGDFREFARADKEREEWTATVTLKDGRRVFCRFGPQKGGGTVAIFRILSAERRTAMQEAV